MAQGAFGAATLFVAGSIVLGLQVLPDPQHRAVGSISSDSTLSAWWLHWTAWALTHGQNPLYTTWQHYPGGVNAMWNTTVPVLGVVLAPVTFIAGPTASYNLAMLLGPVVCASLTFWAMGPYARSWVSRTLAGAMYGFGPFLIAHLSAGHLNIVWAVLPPLLLRLVHPLLVEPRHPWRTGALLGLAFAVQTGLYTQTVALGALSLVVVAAVLAARRPRDVAARVGPVLRAGVAAAAVYLVLCAYPLWLVVAGPGRPRTTIRDVGLTGADLANVVLPSRLTLLSSDPLGRHLVAHPGEQGAYLGVAVLAVVVVALVALRSAVASTALSVGAILLVLSLGGRLLVFGHDTGLPMPAGVLASLPLFSEIEGSRFSPFVALCVVLVVALALERARTRDGRIAFAVVAVILVSWMPHAPLATTTTATPLFFTQGAPGLRPDDVVALWPRATGAWNGGARPLAWQSEAGLSFRMIDGYFIGSDVDHPLLLQAPGSAFDDQVDPVAARNDLQTLGVSAIVVVPQPDLDLPRSLAFVAAVAGHQGTATAGVWVFRLH